MAYEGERAMFEAFGRNKYGATGVIQWMLNNAWPSIIWHLYDYDLRPGGGYFGAKKACEPLHVQYSYDDRSVAVVNSYYRAFPGYTVAAKAYDLDLAEKFSRTTRVDIAEDSVARVFQIPELPRLSTTYFVKLELRNPAGDAVSRNFYWLSTKPDVSNWEASNGRYTPLRSYADFTALESLPRVKLRWSSRAAEQDAEHAERVTVENPGKAIAFLVHLRLMAGNREVAPVRWEDNYFELMPGEARTVSARVHRKDLHGAQVRILCEGWNVE
jgi:exo-1,4-beta-D-glucosaminidase